MGLNSDDQTPDGLSLREAYNSIYSWYKANISLIGQPTDDYRKKSHLLISVLPSESSLTDLEIRAILSEIISGLLEWAYHESDGSYKMAAYAHSAFKAATISFHFTSEERDELKKSRLWPYLRFNAFK